MQSLHRAPVAEDEIDELGHFSAPFYDRRAYLATAAIAAQMGFDQGRLASEGLELVIVDAYRANLAEQFRGADLEVIGGAIEVTPARLRCYHEIRNVDTGVLSATFVHEAVLRRVTDAVHVPWPRTAVATASSLLVEWPEQGRGRSIDLEHKPVMPLYADVESRAFTLPQSVSPEDCDENGRFLTEVYQGLPYNGEKVDAELGQWVIETEDGRTLGVADLETRNIYHAIPEAGLSYQVFSAPTSISGKTYVRHYWAFDINDKTLLATFVVVAIMLDLDARRSAEIPPSMLKKMQAELLPALGARGD